MSVSRVRPDVSGVRGGRVTIQTYPHPVGNRHSKYRRSSNVSACRVLHFDPHFGHRFAVTNRYTSPAVASATAVPTVIKIMTSDMIVSGLPAADVPEPATPGAVR